MQIMSLDNSNTILNGLKSGDVLKAVISKKTSNGYVLILNGKEVHAQSQINFTLGELLTLKIIEISQTRLLLRLVRTDKNIEALPDSGFISEFANNTEAGICLLLTSNLNLPITKERISLINEFLMESINHKAGDSISKSSIAKNCLSEQNGDLEHLLLLKMLNVLHKTTNNINVFFFSPSHFVYDKVYAKFTQNSENIKQKNQLCLSFIVDTKNLGSVLVKILQHKKHINICMSFEDNQALDTVKDFISKLKDTTSPVVRSIDLKIGSISKKNFFFENLEPHRILPGIDVRL